MRILLVYTGVDASVGQWYAEIASRAPPHLQVRCFPLTVPGFKTHIPWETLDLAWRCRHPALMKAYAGLQAAADAAEVLLLYNGYNLHPDMLSSLSTFNVFCFFDDPESSDTSSRYVAPAFDAVFYGNVAARFQYLDWGCHRTAYLPVFTAPRDIPSLQEQPSLLSCPRDNDILLCCSRQGGPWRRRRLRTLCAVFPEARCFGKGWPDGFLDQEALHNLYRHSRIGWNVHHSTGPINRRLFTLAAWNILQICDNKTGLGEVFELGREVIGFDTIDEAIEMTHYYLAHEEERKTIAARGFQRYWRDYHPEALWYRMERQVNTWRSDLPERSSHTRLALPLKHPVLSWFSYSLQAVPQFLRNAMDRWYRSARKRSDAGTWPLDERFYLSTPVSYNPKKSLRKRRRVGAQRESGRHPMIEQQALAWAATALIGKARSIRVLGSDIADYFVTCATVDQDRIFHRHTGHLKIDSCHSDAFDLIVAFDRAAEAIVSSSIHMWEELPSCTPCVLGYTDQQVAALGGSNALYTLLSRPFKEISFYWLPDPVVPWIEPLTGPLNDISVIARGMSHTKVSEGR